MNIGNHAPPSGDVRTIGLEYPPIGGVPVLHQIPREWPVEQRFPTPWPDSTAAQFEFQRRGPDVVQSVVVEHVIGAVRTSSMERCDGVPAEDGYFRDDQGKLVVEFAPTPFPTTTTHLVTRRAGSEYLLYYPERPLKPLLPWARERVIHMVSWPARGEGFVVHAMGFQHPAGFGVVAPARAGTGKSTLAGLIRAFDPKIALLSDDRLILRTMPSRFDICGTPWKSAAGAASPACAPLGAIIFLERASVPAMWRVEPAETLRRILQCVALPYWDDAAMDIALAALDRLIATVPAVACAYPLDLSSVAWLIDGILETTHDR